MARRMLLAVLLLVMCQLAVHAQRGQIAFSSDRDGTNAIWVMNDDGTNPVRVSKNVEPYWGPHWSPDGTRLAFLRIIDTWPHLAVLNPQSGEVFTVTRGDGQDQSLDWAPDGKKLVFHSVRNGEFDIYVTNLDGTGEKRLTNADCSNAEPCWSPDGTKILFSSYRSGTMQLYTMDTMGVCRRIMTDVFANQGTWSPDGTQITFVSRENGKQHICVINADGSGFRRLTNEATTDVGPAWSPDGKQIAFTSDREGNSEIFVINADGTNLRNLTNNPANDGGPSWSAGPGQHPLLPEIARVPYEAAAPGPARQNPTLSKLTQALDADAATWATAVRETVADLPQLTAGKDCAVNVYLLVAQIEDLRPALLDARAPAGDVKPKIQALIKKTEDILALRPGSQFPSVQYQPPRRADGGNTALQQLQGPPTPLAVQALIDFAVTASPQVEVRAVLGLLSCDFPEMGKLVEHVFSTHRSPDSERYLTQMLSSKQLRYPYAEAACLLSAIRLDNYYWDSYSSVVSNWKQWGSPRVAHVLPCLIAAVPYELPAQQAAQALAGLSGLQIPGERTWTPQRRVLLYRAWRDAPQGSQAHPLPDLIAPEWDAANPVVAALATESANLDLAHQKTLVADAGAALGLRRSALRVMAFEGTPDCRQTVANFVPAEPDWGLLGYALRLARELDPPQAAALQALLTARLQQEGAGGFKAVELAMLAADDQQTVQALASLVGAADRQAVCDLCQDIARGQTEYLQRESKSFAGIRNSVAAYDALAHDDAVAFYRSLLSSGIPRVRDVGVYAMGELRVKEAISELIAGIVRDHESEMAPAAVTTALGKIGTPEAHDALIVLLKDEKTPARMGRTIVVMMCAISDEARYPTGMTWERGSWYTPATDKATLVPRFAEAMRQFADHCADQYAASEARQIAEQLTQNQLRPVPQ